MTKHILVTNDDGVLAPGLLALTGEMRKLGHVSILAPDRNWSGGGHVKTQMVPGRWRKRLCAKLPLQRQSDFVRR